MKKLKVLELFSGIGSQTQALKNIGIEHESTQCDIDKYAVNVYNQLHGETTNLGDISKIDENTLTEGQWDLIIYSSPCFTGDTLVLTDDGYKYIKDIQNGDKVLTHTNTYKTVTNVFDNGIKPIIRINNCINCTPNHKFYVREKLPKTKNEEQKYSEPIWKEAKTLTKNDFRGYAINQESIIPTFDNIVVSNNLCWIIGKYLACGFCNDNEIIFKVSNLKMTRFTEKLQALNIEYIIEQLDVSNNIHISNSVLFNLLSKFGETFEKKHIIKDIFNLPIDMLKDVLDGYFSIEGWYNKSNTVWKCDVHNNEILAQELRQCIMKVFKRFVKCTIVDHSSILFGKNIDYRLSYNTEIKPKEATFYNNGYIWVPFKNVVTMDNQNVYDIEVEDDHSFVANGIIVHNCQDFSISGLQAGGEKGSGTRSSLLWECEKIIRKVKPKYLLMENVKNLVSKKFLPLFESWLKVLESYGYTNYWKVLNAKDFGVPQNRERVFCVSILGEHKPYTFPKGFPLTKRLKDILEEKVDEKYYLSLDIQQRFKYNLQSKNKKIDNIELKQLGGIQSKENQGDI